MKEKWTSITGASSGIGASYAILQAKQNKNLILSGRHQDRLESIKEACLLAGAKAVELIICDFNNRDDIERFMTFHRQKGDIERFVSCAGFGLFEDLRAHDEGNILKMVKVNLIATMLLTKEMAILMLEQGLEKAEIALIASVASKVYTPRSSVYAATKAGLYAFCKGLSQDLWDTPIQVTCVLPGPTETAFFDVADPSGDYFKRVKAFSTTPDQVAKQMDRAINKGHTEVVVPKYYDYIARFNALFPELGAKLTHAFYAMGKFR